MTINMLQNMIQDNVRSVMDRTIKVLLLQRQVLLDLSLLNGEEKTSVKDIV